MQRDVLKELKPEAEELMRHLAEWRRLMNLGDKTQGQRHLEAAGRIMAQSSLSAWVLGKFKRERVSAEHAEDLAMDVWRKLISQPYENVTNAYALIARMVHSRLLDFVQQREGTEEDPKFRAGNEGAEGDGDGETWIDAIDRLLGGTTIDLALRQCVHLKVAEMGRQSPSKLELVVLHAEGFSAREMASIVLRLPEEAVTKKHEGAMRDRLMHAVRLAQQLFKECKE